MTRIAGTLFGHQNTHFILSRSRFLRMRNVSDKMRRYDENTHFVFKNIFFFFENRAVYEIM